MKEEMRMPRIDKSKQLYTARVREDIGEFDRLSFPGINPDMVRRAGTIITVSIPFGDRFPDYFQCSDYVWRGEWLTDVTPIDMDTLNEEDF